VPALSPLCSCRVRGEIQHTDRNLMFQRFADARTALASGDIQLTAFVRRTSPRAGPRPSRSSGSRRGSGNDCLIVRKAKT